MSFGARLGAPAGSRLADDEGPTGPAGPAGPAGTVDTAAAYTWTGNHDFTKATGNADLKVTATEDAGTTFSVVSARNGTIPTAQMFGLGINYAAGGTGPFQARRAVFYGGRSGGVAVVAGAVDGEVSVWTGGVASGNRRLLIDAAGIATLNGKRVTVHEESTSVLGAAAQSVSFALDGTEDAIEIIGHILGAVDTYAHPLINAAVTNVSCQSLQTDGSFSLSAANRMVNLNGGGYSLVRWYMETKVRGAGLLRGGFAEGLNRTSGPAWNIWHRSNVLYSDAATAISSAGIETDSAGGLGAGSVFLFRKIRRYV